MSHVHNRLGQILYEELSGLYSSSGFQIVAPNADLNAIQLQALVFPYDPPGPLPNLPPGCAAVSIDIGPFEWVRINAAALAVQMNILHYTVRYRANISADIFVATGLLSFLNPSGLTITKNTNDEGTFLNPQIQTGGSGPLYQPNGYAIGYVKGAATFSIP